MCYELYFDEKDRIVKMCAIYMFMCLCECLYSICVHKHLNLLKITVVRSRQNATLELFSLQASLMDVNGQSATTHTHKNTCTHFRTGSKTHSIEHRSTQSVGAERRGNLKSCPLNNGHLLTLNTVCLSAGSHSSPNLLHSNHCLMIIRYLNWFLISH